MEPTLHIATQAHRYTAESLIRDAQEQGTYFGDRKVFLSTVPGVYLFDAECVAMLDELRLMGLIEVARADFVAGIAACVPNAYELLAASEWSQDGATAHFLLVPPRS